MDSYATWEKWDAELSFTLALQGTGPNSLYATCTSPTMHLICPPNFAWTFVFHLSWVLQLSQEKLKTMIMQNFEGQIRCIMGDVRVACSHNVFKEFWAKKPTRVLVLNLVKISKDFLFLISIFLKFTETKFGLDPVCYFWTNILVCVPHADVYPLNYALTFYPVMNIL